jgi:zinc protease
MTKIAIILLSFLGIVLACLGGSPPALAQATDWQKIPVPPLHTFHPQQPKRIDLPTGMVIFLQEDHELPIVDGIARVRGGSRSEPASKVGMLDLYGEVWRTGGTKTQTGDQLDDFLEVRAAKVETSGNADSTTISWSCLKGDLDDVFRVFVDLLRAPEFRDDKLDLAQKQAFDAISRRNDDIAEIASRESTKLAYGAQNPYARVGEYATIAAVTREDLINWHHQHVQPNNIILGVVGDFDSAAMEAKLRRAFESWPKGPATKDPVIDFTPAKPGYYLVTKADVNQSSIHMVELGTRRDNPDYYAIQVFNEAFGGGFSSRLIRSVRTAKGLAYDVGAAIGTRFDHPGILQLWVGTKSASTVESIQAINEQIDDLAKNPISDEEVSRAKDSILSSFVFNFDSPEKVLREQLAYAFYGYPADFLERYQAGIGKVTKEDVARIIPRYLHKDKLAVLVVGNAPEFDKPLSALGPVTNVDITIPPPPGQKEEQAAPAASNPEGKALAAKVVAALGGETKVRSVKALRSDYNLTQKTPQGDLQFAMKATVVFPDHLHVAAQGQTGTFSIVAVPGGAFMAMGGGVRDMPASQSAETLAQVKRDLIYIAQHANDPSFIFAAQGSEKIGNVDARIVDVRGDGVAVRWFVDPQTGRVLREHYKTMGRNGPSNAETDLDDWKTSEGLTLPYSHTNKDNGEDSSTMQYTSVQINPTVDPKIFERPPAAPAPKAE